MDQELTSVTIEEYKNYDEERKSRYWDWRRRALDNDILERRMLYNKIRSVSSKYKIDTITGEESLILKLQTIINLANKKIIEIKSRRIKNHADRSSKM